MSLAPVRVMTVARREFITTIRRKAFLITLVGTPLYFALITALSSGTAISEGKKTLKEFHELGVVDSSGLFHDATTEIRSEIQNARSPMFSRGPAATGLPQTFRTHVRFYDDQPRAERALRSGEISQELVIPADYLASGAVRRYSTSSNPFSGADGRAVSRWLAANLIRGRVDSLTATRVEKPSEREQVYTLDKQGQFVVQDDNRDAANVFFPMFFTLIFGLCLTVGGQYLLQGISEEKESRILESLMCTVSPEELMAGKLIGLGSVGLMVVAIWIGMGLMVAGPMLAAMHITVPPALLALAVAYFVVGYLFYGSLMVGIGGITNNMREAQQFSVWFTFANFAPMIAIWPILSRPGGPLAIALSMFPPTAATSMLLRLAVPNSQVPPWQVAVSLAVLATTAWVTLQLSARIFRIGMLLYGKTPNLPEILRWVRQR
ncbi:MAG TPA: ABC transporter permease [Dongiaceae bacterium]|nr:ABC transporter permease [Dongiaceae bacterium]